MRKKYNNSFIHIQKIHERERTILVRSFPVLMKCKRKHDPIRILEAIFYLLRSGCQWRLLPECYPHWKSVYNNGDTGMPKAYSTAFTGFFLKKPARSVDGMNLRPSVL
ncbi:MAG: transposase [Muribaculum sp.]|nr:transposase [Muribaculum sp.]